ncbi:glycerate kinase [Microbacterium abyssi]|uniref:glycerate kinase n=1 Tax=Microbacterium abyssi TaxID=2782166 RepID=UPI001889392A|nr:glycerate kinase [Microbacterium sp. A18JL241]
MKVVIAPDSFKGSITAADAATALAKGWASVDPFAEIVLRPMADGGEGTVAAFAAAVPGAELIPVTVDGPAGRPVAAQWLLLPPSDTDAGGTAVIDLASTSGIELMDELRPWDADSTGFGQAIAAALDQGASRLVLGIGSSASTDGGLGMLTVLGARFFDAAGKPVVRGARGLTEVAEVDLSALRPAPETLVLTDVTNPLVGPRGAAAVFGPQKGLTEPQDILAVDGALARWGRLLGLDPTHPGSGAAGGVGGALIAWGGVLAPGAGEVAQLIGLADAIATSDIVVTGEGSYDGQSSEGKVPSHVAGLAAAAGTGAMLVAGRITEDADASAFAASVSLTDIAGSSAAALAEPARHLRAAGVSLAREQTR